MQNKSRAFWGWPKRTAAFLTETCHQPQPRLGTPAWLRYWATVSPKTLWDPIKQAVYLDLPTWQPCSALLGWTLQSFPERSTSKRRGREEHFGLGKIGLIELEVAEVITLCELTKEQYPNKRQSDTTVTTKSVLEDNWQGNIYFKNPQDINCIFTFCIKKTKHHENSWI